MSLPSIPQVPPRSAALRGARAMLLLGAIAGCAAPAPPASERAERYPTLRPGDARLAARRPAGAECFAVTSIKEGDSGGRPLGSIALEWGTRGNEQARPTWLRSAFGQQTEDTVVYDGRSLAPEREMLRVGDQRITLRYRGRTVERTVQRGDSVSPMHAVTFDRPVFAFNQRELLLRVVRLQPGDTVILPLYSEIDAALELDTIALLPSHPSRASSPTVRIRFADPAIVAILTVDTIRGQVLEEEIRNRLRPGRLMRTLNASVAPPCQAR